MTFRNKPLIANNHSVTVAAVDLGSNSFHLLIGKTKKTKHGFQIRKSIISIKKIRRET